MKTLVAWLLFSGLVSAQSLRVAAPEIVEFPSGNLHLKAFLWRPAGAGPFPAILFNHGSGGPDALHTSGLTMREAAETLGPVFAGRGYVFLFPCRRGQGLSADQGRFIQHELNDQERTKGPDARRKLQLALMGGPQLDDTIAGLAFLRGRAGVDSNRIAVVGHSFGGQLTILDAERDKKLRAVVTFGAAANSWAQSPELRTRLLAAIRNVATPIMLIHAANDYDTTPGQALAAELLREHKPHVLKIYPAVGVTPDEGHSQVYKRVSDWEDDVFRFLEENMRP